ncbi:unnamed protein product [Paramecium sonneborni]|uniref:Uncharacterized protein n=1 Tax=Paramecium sonneborni TaxID=65129 RepID=A0A8S1RR61_9CILI|nr:unnamed protein product [Paramecium sonneborni]
MLNQIQQQQYTQKLDQTQMEIQYYIYQDLENVLCLLGELEQTIKTFKDIEDKSYIPIAQNKTILQANLSFGIHFDQYSQHNKKYGDFLKQCNEKAERIFKECVSDLDLFQIYEQDGKKIIDPKIQDIYNFYLKKSLKAEKNFDQLPLLPISREAQFIPDVVVKVIGGIQTVDNQLQKVRNGTYTSPTTDIIKDKIRKRQVYCKQQLEKNFNLVNDGDIRNGRMEIEVLKIGAKPTINKYDQDESQMNKDPNEKQNEEQNANILDNEQIQTENNEVNGATNNIEQNNQENKQVTIKIEQDQNQTINTKVNNQKHEEAQKFQITAQMKKKKGDDHQDIDDGTQEIIQDTNKLEK